MCRNCENFVNILIADYAECPGPTRGRPANCWVG